MKFSFAAAAFVLAQVVPALGVSPLASRGLGIKSSGQKAVAHPNPEAVGQATFDQLLNHSMPSSPTFKQRYWWDATYWGGPGSPVFLFNSGESAADDFTGYLTNATIPGLYAQKFGGAVILIERRCLLSQSNPSPRSTMN
jgi:hypothetical protein